MRAYTILKKDLCALEILLDIAELWDDPVIKVKDSEKTLQFLFSSSWVWKRSVMGGKSIISG